MLPAAARYLATFGALMLAQNANISAPSSKRTALPKAKNAHYVARIILIGLRLSYMTLRQLGDFAHSAKITKEVMCA